MRLRLRMSEATEIRFINDLTGHENFGVFVEA